MKGSIRASCLLMVVCICAAAFAGCAAHGRTNDEERILSIDKEETYAEAPGQLQKVYSSISQLVSDADSIIKGRVIRSEVELLNELPQTHTVLETEEVLKGELDIGSEVEVIEEGGDGGQVMGGVPCMADGTEYYLFLNEDGGNYYICGAFQGRFIIREGYVFQQATEDVKLKAYSPVNVDEFKKLVG